MNRLRGLSFLRFFRPDLIDSSKTMNLRNCSEPTAVRQIKKVMEEEKTQANCKEVGSYLLRGLGALRGRYGGAVRDVRGKGLMIGVELRGPRLTLAVLEHCRALGVLMGKGGLEGNVLRIKPPMCITREDVDFTLQVLQDALEQEGEGAGREGAKAEAKEYVFLSGV